MAKVTVDPTQERWLPVVGFEGFYEVSDHGHIRSVDRHIESRMPSGHVRRQFRRGKPLKTSPGPDGYLSVHISRDGQGVVRMVHHVVLEAFIGARPEGMITRHLEGDPTDNRLGMIVYGTPQENSQDKLRHGTDFNASKTHCDHGHEFTEENTYRYRGRERHCRTCKRERKRHHRAMRKVA